MPPLFPHGCCSPYVIPLKVLRKGSSFVQHWPYHSCKAPAGGKCISFWWSWSLKLPFASADDSIGKVEERTWYSSLLFGGGHRKTWVGSSKVARRLRSFLEKIGRVILVLRDTEGSFFTAWWSKISEVAQGWFICKPIVWPGDVRNNFCPKINEQNCCVSNEEGRPQVERLQFSNLGSLKGWMVAGWVIQDTFAQICRKFGAHEAGHQNVAKASLKMMASECNFANAFLDVFGGFLQAYVRFGPSYLLLGCKSFVGFARLIGFQVAGGQSVMVSEEHARN